MNLAKAGFCTRLERILRITRQASSRTSVPHHRGNGCEGVNSLVMIVQGGATRGSRSERDDFVATEGANSVELLWRLDDSSQQNDRVAAKSCAAGSSWVTVTHLFFGSRSVVFVEIIKRVSRE